MFCINYLVFKISLLVVSACPRGLWGKDCKRPCECPSGYTCHHLTGDCFVDYSPPRRTTTTTTTTTTKRPTTTTAVPTTQGTTLETVKTPVFRFPPPPWVDSTSVGKKTTTRQVRKEEAPPTKEMDAQASPEVTVHQLTATTLPPEVATLLPVQMTEKPIIERPPILEFLPPLTSQEPMTTQKIMIESTKPKTLETVTTTATSKPIKKLTRPNILATTSPITTETKILVGQTTQLSNTKQVHITTPEVSTITTETPLTIIPLQINLTTNQPTHGDTVPANDYTQYQTAQNLVTIGTKPQTMVSETLFLTTTTPQPIKDIEASFENTTITQPVLRFDVTQDTKLFQHTLENEISTKITDSILSTHTLKETTDSTTNSMFDLSSKTKSRLNPFFLIPLTESPTHHVELINKNKEISEEATQIFVNQHQTTVPIVINITQEIQREMTESDYNKPEETKFTNFEDDSKKTLPGQKLLEEIFVHSATTEPLTTSTERSMIAITSLSESQTTPIPTTLVKLATTTTEPTTSTNPTVEVTTTSTGATLPPSTTTVATTGFTTPASNIISPTTETTTTTIPTTETTTIPTTVYVTTAVYTTIASTTSIPTTIGTTPPSTDATIATPTTVATTTTTPTTVSATIIPTTVATTTTSPTTVTPVTTTVTPTTTITIPTTIAPEITSTASTSTSTTTVLPPTNPPATATISITSPPTNKHMELTESEINQHLTLPPLYSDQQTTLSLPQIIEDVLKELNIHKKTKLDETPANQDKTKKKHDKMKNKNINTKEFPSVYQTKVERQSETIFQPTTEISFKSILHEHYIAFMNKSSSTKSPPSIKKQPLPELMNIRYVTDGSPFMESENSKPSTPGNRNQLWQPLKKQTNSSETDFKEQEQFSVLEEPVKTSSTNVDVTEMNKVMESNTIDYRENSEEPLKKVLSQEDETNYSLISNKIKFNMTESIAAGVQASRSGPYLHTPMILVLGIALVTLLLLTLTLWVYLKRRRERAQPFPPCIMAYDMQEQPPMGKLLYIILYVIC